MELEIKIGGMMCDGCTSRVTEVLQKAEGVKSVQVSEDTRCAVLVYLHHSIVVGIHGSALCSLPAQQANIWWVFGCLTGCS